MRSRYCVLFFAALLVLPAGAAALDKAEEIAQKAFDRDDGRDSYAKVEMTLIDKSGKERPRTLEMAARDYGELSKRYIYFNAPSSIEGTGFLAWENLDRDDDQFLYLPAVGRSRRIVSSQKDRSFVNTDYTFEDLQRQKVENYNHKLNGEEPCLNRKCYVLESTPKTEDLSIYARKVSWIDKDSYVIMKVDYYDKKGRHVKIFEAKEVKLIDSIWTVSNSEMNDLENFHKTTMKIADIRYNKGVAEKIFSEGYLERRE